MATKSYYIIQPTTTDGQPNPTFSIIYIQSFLLFSFLPTQPFLLYVCTIGGMYHIQWVLAVKLQMVWNVPWQIYVLYTISMHNEICTINPIDIMILIAQIKQIMCIFVTKY